MTFHDVARPIYLETDTSDIRLEAILLQLRNVMNCRHDEGPDTTILHPIVFASKSLLNPEVALQQHRI